MEVDVVKKKNLVVRVASLILRTPFKMGFCCGSKCESSCNQQKDNEYKEGSIIPND
jgi:hypothetical protein